MGGEQEQLVRHPGKLVHAPAALRAVGEMLQGSAALLALDDPERELGGKLAGLLAARVHSSPTNSSSRSLSMAVRIRVFTVPSGTSSRSLISRAVRPM